MGTLCATMLRLKAVGFGLLFSAFSAADLGDFFPMEKLSKAPSPKLTTKSTGTLRVDGVSKPNGTLGLLGLAQLTKPRAKTAAPTISVERLTLSDENQVWANDVEAFRLDVPTSVRKSSLAAYIVPKTAEEHRVYLWLEGEHPVKIDEKTFTFSSGRLKELARFSSGQMKPGVAVRVPTGLDEIGRHPLVILPRSRDVTAASGTSQNPLLIAETPIGKLARFSFPTPETFSIEDRRWGAPFQRHEASPPAFFMPSAEALEFAYINKEKKLKLARIRPGSPAGTFELPVMHGEVSSFVRSAAGEYYYFTFESGRNPTASIVKASKDGQLLARTDLANDEKAFDLLGLSRTTSTLALAPGGVLLTSSRGMQSGHQGSFAAVFNPSTLALVKNFGQSCSHSFANRAFFEGDTFITADLGDNYPRGIVVHRLGYERTGRVVFTYKTQHSKTDESGRKGHNDIDLLAGRWSNDNGTYTRLGDIIPTTNGYLVAFAGEQTTDNLKAVSDHNESHNVGMVLVRRDFARIPQTESIVPPSMILNSNEVGPLFGFFDYSGQYTRQQNAGVTWLTTYTDKSKDNAAQVRAVSLDRERVLVLWEVWSSNQYRETHGLVINEFGRPLGKLMNLGSQARIPDGARLQVQDGYILWSGLRSGSFDVFAWKLEKS